MDRAAAISAANEVGELINQGIDPKFNAKPILLLLDCGRAVSK